MQNKRVGGKKGKPGIPTATVTASLSTASTGATDLAKAEDAVHASGDVGVAVWAVRKDTAAATAADGDYHPIEVDSTGRVHTNIGTYGAGAVAATTPRATLASDDPAVVSLAILDDWDESDRAKVNPIAGQAGVAAGAGAVGVTVQRVTLASDDPAVAALKSASPSGTAWSYAAATGGITNTTTAVTIKAADGSLRNYISAMQISSDPLGVATEFAIRDGAAGTVLWRMKIGTAGIVNGLQIRFDPPLFSTAATLLEVVTLTASLTGGVFVNAQGFVAA